jgi:hypothetical protein
MTQSNQNIRKCKNPPKVLYHYSLHKSFDEQLACADAAKAIAVFQTSKNNRGQRLQPTLAVTATVRAPARLYSGQGGNGMD